MANVTGVSQLMEIVAAAPAQGQTPNASSSSTSGTTQSFATVMQQANTDAGVPAAPVEPQTQATAQAKSDSGKVVRGSEEQALTLAPDLASELASVPASVPALPASGVIKAGIAAGTAQSSLRYSPANMLSAMLGGTEIKTASAPKIAMDAPCLNSAPPSQVSPPATPLTVVSPATPPTIIPAAAPTTEAATPGQVAAPDGKALDPSAIASLPSPAPALSAKTANKTETGVGHSSTRLPAKQDSTRKASEPTVAPVLVAAVQLATVPVATTVPTATPGNTPEPSALPVTPAASVETSSKRVSAGFTAGTGKLTPVVQPSAGVPLSDVASGSTPPIATFGVQSKVAAQSAPDASALEDVSAVVFRQSLNSQIVAPSAENATAPVTPGGRSLPVGGNKLASIPQPEANSVVASATATPQVLAAPPVPLPTVQDASTAVQAVATAAVLAPSQTVASPTHPQTSAAHKAIGKPSLSGDAPQTVVSAPALAAIPATTLTSSADAKASPHPAVAAVAAPAPVAESSVSAVSVVPVAHTPVAITALSNANGPALTTALPSSVASSTMGDTMPHSTLSSTPTTLEVGVASGTHGWLKIRAELNASGTVDASLTGTNATATGKLHNDLPALSSFLQDEKVALGSLNVSAPGATASALHASAISTLEPTSSFTRSAAEGVGATGTAVASDAGAAGGRGAQQQAPESSAQSTVTRVDDGVAGAITTPAPSLYGEGNDMVGSGALSESGYGAGGSWLNVRV